MIERFQNSFQRDTFDCGNEALNSYLKTIAPQDIKRNLSSVWVKIQQNTVVGYYTLAPFTLLLTELPPSLAKKMPKGKLIPCWLIGKLARDLSVKGRGVGEELLVDALRRVMMLAQTAAGFCVVVDSKDLKATRFYESYGFTVLDKTQNERRLYLPIAEIEKTS